MEIKIDMDGGAIYLQIMDRIKRAIVRGDWKTGGQVISVRDMAIKIGVNPNTVARAYAELEREGMLISKRGMGTFVTEDKKRIEEEKEKLATQYAERFGKEIKEIGISMNVMTKLLNKIVKENESTK
ncbi:MAG: GntR family transcriptional regulator [bacterium]|nr:GntR family transcriptional regulator [bacterium]